MTNPLRSLKTLLALTFVLAVIPTSHAQTVQTLVNFNGTNASDPYVMALTQGFDGKLYGVSSEGGTNTCTLFGFPSICGNVFNTTTSGTMTTLHSFDGTDGASPEGTLVQDASGNFYGVTMYGGANTSCAVFGSNGCGAAFKITSSGTFTSLYNFCSLANCADGANPVGGLLLGADGNLYGTTIYGGASQNCFGVSCGTVFRMTPTGELTTLYTFSGIDGGTPYGPLVQTPNGLLVGVTGEGGTNGDGTVFAMTTGGKITTLHSFNGTDGQVPNPLILATDGNFYGTTTDGGSGTNAMCGTSGCGTAFRITPGGKLKTLYNFCSQANCTDGFAPYWSLFQASDDNIYGMTAEFDPDNGTFPGDGTLFRLNTSGNFINIFTFDGTNGFFPQGAMMQATNGILYGTMGLGGSEGSGTIFILSEGLTPFVAPQPAFGSAGTKVIVLGNNLKGSTAVTFNGVPASFTIVSNTELKTTVPANATTGLIVVTTPHGDVRSNFVFTVN